MSFGKILQGREKFFLELLEQHRPRKREAPGHYPKGEIFEIWCDACKPYIHYLWREGDTVYECDMWKRAKTLGLVEE